MTKHNRGKQLLSLEIQFICLFQNGVGAKPSSICGPLGELVGANKGNTGESKEEDLTELAKKSTRKVGEKDNVQN